MCCWSLRRVSPRHPKSRPGCHNRQVTLSAQAIEPELRDVVYTAGDDPTIAQSFDLYRGGATGGAVLVFLHGGGWRVGDKSHTTHPASLAAQGLTVVNANYTLTPQRPYPQNLNDVFQLVRYLVEHSDELQIDPSLIFLSGASAGGHLSALAVTKGLAEGLLAVPIAGVLSWYAPLDPVSRYLRQRYPSPQRPGGFWDRGLEPGALGNDPFRSFIGTDDFSSVTVRDALDADPRFHLDRVDVAELPPFLLFVGEHDSDEIRSSQRILFDALSWVGADVELFSIAGADHADARFQSAAAVGAAAGFINAVAARVVRGPVH